MLSLPADPSFDPAQPSLFASSRETEDRDANVQTYLRLTGKVMPEFARRPDTDWPVVNDHCFQRIVLDAICGGVWYDHIARPAYKHLTTAQAREAASCCQDILTGRADIHALNRQSLEWRGKAG